MKQFLIYFLKKIDIIELRVSFVSGFLDQTIPFLQQIFNRLINDAEVADTGKALTRLLPGIGATAAGLLPAGLLPDVTKDQATLLLEQINAGG